MPPVPKGERSQRAPQVQPLPAAWEQTKTVEEIRVQVQVLEGSRRRLQDLLEDGWPNADEYLKIVRADIDRLQEELKVRKEPVHVAKESEEEQSKASNSAVRQVIIFSPDAAKYAHYADDLALVWRFANTIAIGNPSSSSTTVEKSLKPEALYKTVLQAVRLMHLCGYGYSDVVLTLAYAHVYFQHAFGNIGHKMSNNESAHVCVLLIYLAHGFVLDETCPLRYWQKYIFRKYCTLKVLDAALFRLFQMRGFRLRITEEEEKRSLSNLLSSTGLDVVVSNTSDSESTAAGLPHAEHASAASSNSTAAGGDTPNHRVPNGVPNGI